MSSSPLKIAKLQLCRQNVPVEALYVLVGGFSATKGK